VKSTSLISLPAMEPFIASPKLLILLHQEEEIMEEVVVAAAVVSFQVPPNNFFNAYALFENYEMVYINLGNYFHNIFTKTAFQL